MEWRCDKHLSGYIICYRYCSCRYYVSDNDKGKNDEECRKNKHNFGEQSLKHGVKPSLKMVLVFKAINATLSAYCNDALLFHAQKGDTFVENPDGICQFIPHLT